MKFSQSVIRIAEEEMWKSKILKETSKFCNPHWGSRVVEGNFYLRKGPFICGKWKRKYKENMKD